jgi:hypothetical protein
MVPHSKLCCSFSECYPSDLSDELVDFLLVALSCSSSQSTTARLMAMSVFPCLKCFTHLLTLLTPTHADISIHTAKSLVDDFCRLSSFHKKFNDSTLTKPHVGDSHFLAVHDGNLRGAHALILH